MLLCFGVSFPHAGTRQHQPPIPQIIRDLPLGANEFSILETAQPEVIVDRFTSGGLNAGEPARASAFLALWSQTQYRVGDVSISSPVDGTPTLFPEVAWWDSVAVRTGAMPADLVALVSMCRLHPLPRAYAGWARWTDRSRLDPKR